MTAMGGPDAPGGPGAQAPEAQTPAARAPGAEGPPDPEHRGRSWGSHWRQALGLLVIGLAVVLAWSLIVYPELRASVALVLLFVVLVVLVVGFVEVMVRRELRGLHRLGGNEVKPTERVTVANDTRKTWAGILGGAGAVFAFFFTWQQLQTAQQTLQANQQQQVTDRFVAAIELLGAIRDEADGGKVPNVEGRLGAIYALERLAKDSPTDHRTVMEVLAAYVRENAPATPEVCAVGPGTPPAPELGAESSATSPAPRIERRPRADVEAAVVVIGRNLSTAPIGSERVVLDMHGVDLRGIDLSRAAGIIKRRVGTGVLIVGAKSDDPRAARFGLDRVDLSCARLDGARLGGISLRGAVLAEASLVEADLEHARLEDAQLPGADLTGAMLTYAHFEDASLVGARILPHQLETICSSSGTQFSPGTSRPPIIDPCPPESASGTPPPGFPGGTIERSVSPTPGEPALPDSPPGG